MKKDGVVDIEYVIGGNELIDDIGPLWMELNEHHAEKSPYFTEKFRSFSFDMRRKSFSSNNKEILTVLVKNVKIGEVVGYSISSIEDCKMGEIESIYLKSEYRGLRIGDILMEKPLKWFEEKNIKRVVLGVAIGNENVYPFYEKFGFYPRTAILEKKVNAYLETLIKISM